MCARMELTTSTGSGLDKMSFTPFSLRQVTVLLSISYAFSKFSFRARRNRMRVASRSSAVHISGGTSRPLLSIIALNSTSFFSSSSVPFVRCFSLCCFCVRVFVCVRVSSSCIVSYELRNVLVSFKAGFASGLRLVVPFSLSCARPPLSNVLESLRDLCTRLLLHRSKPVSHASHAFLRCVPSPLERRLHARHGTLSVSCLRLGLTICTVFARRRGVSRRPSLP